CVSCDLIISDSTTNGSASTSSSSCGCDPSSRYLNKDGDCVTCPSPFSLNSSSSGCDCSVGGTFFYDQDECLCDPGYEVDDITGFCSSCDVGSYKEGYSTLDCSSCDLIISDSTTNGSASTSNSSCGCEFDSKYLSLDGSSCLDCPEFSDFIESGSCDCDEGSTFNESSSSCVCDPGYYKNTQSQCVVCLPNSFKSEDGDDLCSSCDDFMTDSITSSSGSTNSSDCHCDDGDYESEDGSECVSCPKGSSCEEGTTIENMEVDGGYWRVDGESDTIHQCPVPKACEGASSNSSSSSSYGDNLCRVGHEGPYCSVCEDGYFKEYNGLCKECSSSSLTNSYILVGVFGVLGIVLTILLIRFV
ncbi:MAG TPA: hypothetical protein EYO58_00450, partial [Flavobacteriales bacterium]|nr:hypothetical protein [Flavobacteriales bacterium]